MKAEEVNQKWNELREVIATNFEMELPDIKVMLFLIGVQELGKVPDSFPNVKKKS